MKTLVLITFLAAALLTGCKTSGDKTGSVYLPPVTYSK